MTQSRSSSVTNTATASETFSPAKNVTNEVSSFLRIQFFIGIFWLQMAYHFSNSACIAYTQILYAHENSSFNIINKHTNRLSFTNEQTLYLTHKHTPSLKFKRTEPKKEMLSVNINRHPDRITSIAARSTKRAPFCNHWKHTHTRSRAH